MDPSEGRKFGKALDKIDYLLFFPFYPLVSWLHGKREIPQAREYSIESMNIHEGDTVLDVGSYIQNNVRNIPLYPNTGNFGFLARNRVAYAKAAREIRNSGKGNIALFHEKEDTFADASIDKVLMTYVFSATDQEDKDNLIQEVDRILKPGGIVSILDYRWGDSISYADYFANPSFPSKDMVRMVGLRRAWGAVFDEYTVDAGVEGLLIEWVNLCPQYKEEDTQVFSLRRPQDVGFFDGVNVRTRILRKDSL